MNKTVGVFFIVNGKTLLHTCGHDQAEVYGMFLNYPLSHDEVWRKEHRKQYAVDFDYYPRGRILYDMEHNITRIFHDRCIENEAINIASDYEFVELLLDEHYQCHQCHAKYPDLAEE